MPTAKKQLPVLQVKIDAEKEFFIDAIALVDAPAIMSNFIALKEHKPEEVKRLLLSSDERRELLGAALIPDLQIYRKDPETGEEYYIVFDAETIREASQIFMRNGYQVNLNMQHTDKPAKSYVYQSYIVDNERGMLSPDGLNLPSGSWVIGVKVEDPETWEEVKAGRANGFSVEGLFLFRAAKNTEKSNTFDQLLEVLENIKIN